MVPALMEQEMTPALLKEALRSDNFPTVASLGESYSTCTKAYTYNHRVRKCHLFVQLIRKSHRLRDPMLHKVQPMPQLSM
jgi:hypothetical protein